jgi:hypothetical protein
MMVNSKEKMLDPIEIIRIALENTKSEYTTEEGIAAIISETRTPNAITMREGNTLFLIHYVQNRKDHGMFRALNADTAGNYLKNSMTFIKAAGMAGFKVLVSQFKDPTILNIFKSISRKPPFPGMGYSVQRTKDGGYQVTVNLGHAKTTDKGALPAQPKRETKKGAL